MRRSIAVLAVLLTPSLALADQPHRAGFLTSVGANTPVTLEVYGRPTPKIELSAAYGTGNVYCHCDGELLGPSTWDRYSVTRYEGTARVRTQASAHVSLHAGVGVGWEDGLKEVGRSGGLFDGLFGESTYANEAEDLEGAYGKLDAGITVERSVVSARLSVGAGGRDPLPYIAFGVGFGY